MGKLINSRTKQSDGFFTSVNHFILGTLTDRSSYSKWSGDTERERGRAEGREERGTEREK